MPTRSERIAGSEPPKDAGSNFGQLVAFFRQRRGLSQGQLARAARLSRTYVYHLETAQRLAPSARVARTLARALELHGDDRRQFADAFTRLTGQQVEEEPEAPDLLDQRELAALLVESTAFPAHSLDRLWNIVSWNTPSMQLFEVTADAINTHRSNLLVFVFDLVYRTRFRPWEGLARRLLADFKHATRSLAYLPEYRDLWRTLRAMPDFRRIAESAETGVMIAPSFVFQMRHSHLGSLTLRTSATVFSGVSDYSIVTYMPGDQRTLAIFAEHGWQKLARNM